MTDNVDRARRSLVAALCASPIAAPSMLMANVSPVNFYYSRSGRFTAYGSDDVFIGGILADPDQATEIEKVLAIEAEVAGFGLDLTVGTNRHLPAFLELSLNVLAGFQTDFFAAAIQTEDGEVEPDILTSIRTQHEADALSSGNDAGHYDRKSIHLIGVKHARNIDDKIYDRLLDRGAFASMSLTASHSETSLLYRLSSVLTKCIAAAYYGRTLTKARDEMRSVVLSRFDILDPEPVNAGLSIIPIQKK